MLDRVRFCYEEEHFADRAGRRVCERIFCIDICLAVRKPSSQVTQGRSLKNQSVRGLGVAAKSKVPLVCSVTGVVPLRTDAL